MCLPQATEQEDEWSFLVIVCIRQKRRRGGGSFLFMCSLSLIMCPLSRSMKYLTRSKIVSRFLRVPTKNQSISTPPVLFLRNTYVFGKYHTPSTRTICSLSRTHSTVAPIPSQHNFTRSASWALSQYCTYLFVSF